MYLCYNITNCTCTQIDMAARERERKKNWKKTKRGKKCVCEMLTMASHFSSFKLCYLASFFLSFTYSIYIIDD